MSDTQNQLHNWQKENVTEYDLKRMKDAATAMRSMCNVIIQDIGRYNFKPSDDSKASEEIELHQEVEAAYSKANMLLDSIFDHADNVTKSLIGSKSALTPWSVARTILELCSIASWLLDPDINCKKRVTRAMIKELQDLRAEDKFHRNNADTIVDLWPEFDFNSQEYEITKKINRLRKLAEKLEITVKYSQEEEIVTFGSGERPISNLIEQYSWKGRIWYDILSGVVHGNQGIMLHLSFKFEESNNACVKQYLNPREGFLLVALLMTWIGETMWRWYELFGWDLNQLRKILESHYDKARISDGLKFWRKNSPV